MNDQHTEAFIGLFKDAFRKCFGFPIAEPLSETESRHFANKIFEDTGLVIGPKSIKNYSLFVLNSADAKPENPSVATLDTFARFVLDAPYTDEVKRKEKEGHYPYWYQYKNKFSSNRVKVDDKPERVRKKGNWVPIIAIVALVVSGIFLWMYINKKEVEHFVDDFHSVNNDSLKQHGWILKSADEKWWSMRGQMQSHLSLFTLRGDNWADSANAPEIKNLLLRKINSDCFTTEIHFDDFVPRKNWQQAGLLLLEDSLIDSKSIRLSLAYNDFFGGYQRPGEIIIQAISSNSDDLRKPEEIAHVLVATIDTGKQNLASDNLRKSALKIEKNETHFRFLFSSGPLENAAFKEILARDIMIHPKYIGIFALQGFVRDTSVIPVQIRLFSINAGACEK